MTGADRIQVVAQGQSLDNLSKKASDLIDEDVKISWTGTAGKVTGGIKEVKNWTEFSSVVEDQTGHFFPVQLDEKYRDQPITVAGNEKEKTETDLMWVLKVDNSKNFTFKQGEDTIVTLDLTGASLK